MQVLIKMIQNNYRILIIAFGILLAIGAAYMPFGILLFTVGVGTIFVLHKDAKFCLVIMIIIAPFASTSIFQMQPLPFLPIKFIVFIYLFMFAIVFIRYRMNLNLNSEKYLVFLYVVYLTVFSIAVFKSLDYISAYNRAMEDNFSVIRLLNSFWVTPIILMLPPIIILLYYNYQDYPKLISAFIVGILLLSVTILCIYVFFIPNKMAFTNIRSQISSYLGLHGNGIADFYIISFPLLFVVFMNKGSLLVKITFYISLFAIAILFSRTAYVCVILTIVTYNFYRGKLDSRFFGLMIAMGVMFILLPDVVLDRFMTLVSGSDMNTLTAGRTGYIWEPLIAEWSLEPLSVKLLGTGRYMMIQSLGYRFGIIFQATHPHNMYLESLFDIGIVGLATYLFIYFSFIIRSVKVFFHKHIEQYDKDILFGCLLSLGMYFLSGLSGRTMFPSLNNIYSWVIIMITMIISRHYTDNTTKWEKEIKND